MRKEITICIVIIVSVIIVNIITQNYSKSSVNIMDDKLEELEILIEKIEDDNSKNGNLKNEVDEKLNNVLETWKQRYDILAYFIEHDELEKVETELTSLKALIKTSKYEEGIETLERGIFILNHIKEKFSLNIKNIF